jgi:hypothetical protein
MPSRQVLIGAAEATGLAAFWLVFVGAIMFVAIAQGYWRLLPAILRPGRPAWRCLPETRLLVLGLPLELLWETAQFPLYDIWHESGWGYVLYSLVHCTLGDLLILLVTYALVALLNRDRNWIMARPIIALGNGLLFTLIGAGYTVYSELVNVRVEGAWGYTALMPVVPIIGVGGMPLLQWLLIPPVLLWLMRLTRVPCNE